MTRMKKKRAMRMRTKSSLALALVLLMTGPAVVLAAEDTRQPYALLFGTVYGPDDRPVYGVKVIIQPMGRSKPKWEAISNHTGEFAQRLPVGPADYVVRTDFKRSKEVPFGPATEVKVHIDKDERQDISLHLTQ